MLARSGAPVQALALPGAQRTSGGTAISKAVTVPRRNAPRRLSVTTFAKKGNGKDAESKSQPADAAPVAPKPASGTRLWRDASDESAVHLMGQLMEHAHRPKAINPLERLPVDVSQGELDIVGLRAQHDHIYNTVLRHLQIELVNMQEFIKAKGVRMIVLFEGPEFAGKAGLISRISEAMSARICKVVALGPGSDRDRGKFYFQRFAGVLPAAGEMVLMYRSWYDRAGVERVSGWCSDAEYELFIDEVKTFERSLTDAGIIVVKYWLEVSEKEQERRYIDRMKHPWKRFVSNADFASYSKWYAFSRARDEMLRRTDSKWAPWLVLNSEDRKAARLNCISHLLSLLDYQSAQEELIAKSTEMTLPPRDTDTYTPPPKEAWRFVPPVYDSTSLQVNQEITKMMNQLKKQKKQRAVADGGKDSSTEGDIDD